MEKYGTNRKEELELRVAELNNLQIKTAEQIDEIAELKNYLKEIEEEESL